MGSAPTSIKLRFTNIVKRSVLGVMKYDLQADILYGDPVPDYLEIECVIQLGYLECAPWPYVNTVIDFQLQTAISLVLETNHNVLGRLVYPLS